MPQLAWEAGQFAQVTLELGDHSAARAWNEAAAEHMRNAPNPTSVDMFLASSRARVEARSGSAPLALDYFLPEFERALEAGHADHALYYDTDLDIASAHQRLGQHEQALTAIERARNAIDGELGHGSRLMVYVQRRAGRLHLAWGHDERACEAFSAAIASFSARDHNPALLAALEFELATALDSRREHLPTGLAPSKSVTQCEAVLSQGGTHMFSRRMVRGRVGWLCTICIQRILCIRWSSAIDSSFDNKL